MEPYNRALRRKIPVFTRNREKRELHAAPAPLDKKELRALGKIGTDPSVEIPEEVKIIEFPDQTPPEDIVA